MARFALIRNQGECERVLEAMRMPPIRWPARPFGNRLERARELRTVNSPAFLREEDEIAGIAPFGEPGAQDTPLGEKWLPWMIGKRLRRGESALESANRNLPILQIQVRQGCIEYCSRFTLRTEEGYKL